MKYLNATFIAALILGMFLETRKLPGEVTNSIATGLSQAREKAYAGVMADRAELEQALKSVPGATNTPEFKAARQAIVERNLQLSKSASDFQEKFPTNDILQISRQATFSRVLKGMLQTQYSGKLDSLAEEIPSCLFKSATCDYFHIPGEQAAQLQSAEESAYVDAVIVALKLEPESYNGIYLFLNRALPKIGQTLAQAILNDPAANDSLKTCARLILNRTFGAGKPLALKFIALDGRQVDLATMRGKVVLVEFWATGCVPCVAGLPELELLYNKYQTHGFEVVGISTDTDKEVLQRVIQEKGIPWPVDMVENGRDGKFISDCGVSGIPNYWLVDAQGIVRETMASTPPVDRFLEGKIKLLLAERR